MTAWDGSIIITGTPGEEEPTCTVRAEIDYDYDEDEDDTALVNLTAYGSINITDSSIEAIVNNDGNAYVNLYAHGNDEDPGTILIDDSSVSSEVTGYGSAEVNMTAGDWEETSGYDEGYDDGYWYYYYSSSSFTGGTIDILDSLVLAIVGSGFDSADIDMTAGDIYINNSSVIAEVLGEGSAHVNLEAGDREEESGYDYSYDDYYWYDSYSSSSFTGGTIDILDSLVLAIVGSGFDSADIDMTAGDIYINNSSVIAEVLGEGSAHVNLEAGDSSNSYEDGYEYDYYYYYHYYSSSSSSFTGGTIDILDSLVLASVGSGFDSADIDMTAGDIYINNSSVIAEVLGEGSANVNLEAGDREEESGYDYGYGGDYYYYYPYHYYSSSSSSFNGGTIDILDSLVLASVGSGYDSADIDITAGDIYIETSSVIAEVLGEGSAHVNMEAGDREEESGYDYGYDDYYWYDSYSSSSFTGGTIDILDSTVLAQVGSGFDSAEVNMEAGIINIQDSAVSAIENG